MNEKNFLLEKKCGKLEKDEDALVTFYTGFPNIQAMIALYEYLDTGVNEKKINTGCQAMMIRKTVGYSVKQGRQRNLAPLE